MMRRIWPRQIPPGYLLSSVKSDDVLSDIESKHSWMPLSGVYFNVFYLLFSFCVFCRVSQ